MRMVLNIRDKWVGRIVRPARALAIPECGGSLLQEQPARKPFGVGSVYLIPDTVFKDRNSEEFTIYARFCSILAFDGTKIRL